MTAHRWKKGVSGNPKGRPVSLPPEIQTERKQNQVGLIRLITTYANLTQEQAQLRLSSPQSLQIEEMVQGIINRAKEGDVNCFKFLMDMMVGKIPEADTSDFTEEDIEILTRVKKIKEQRKIKSD